MKTAACSPIFLIGKTCGKEKKMKAMKRVLVLVMAFVLLMGAALAEAAIVPSSNFIQNMVVTSGYTFDLTMYETSGNLDTNNISVSIDGTNLNVLGANTGTSWIFMVDTSTVSTEYGSAPIIKTLKGLIDGMGVNDNGLVCNPSTMIASRSLSSKTDLASMSNEKLMETNANNPVSLSSAVSAAINYLGTSSQTKNHTALVIISSGNPQGETEASLNSLSPQIQQAKTTVYSVAYTAANPNQNMLQVYLGLGKGSTGGKGIQQPASGKDKSAEEVLGQIAANEEHFKTISVQVPAETPLTSANNLTVSIKGLAPTTISYAIPTEIASQLEIKVEEPGPDSFWEEYKMYIIIGGSALILIVAALIIILSVTRKKKKEIVEVDDAPPPPPVNREVRVTLTREEDGEQFSTVTKGGICVVGRSSDADIPLPDPNMKISREHMQLSYENGIVMLADLGSRNHTFVNGIMVNRKTVMQQGDIIRMGDTEFRISWRQL